MVTAVSVVTAGRGDNGMVVIGVTGHRGLSGGQAEYTAGEMRRVLAPLAAAGLTGISCLAEGADTIFADVVLELGGRLIVMIPAAGYRDFQPATHRRNYDRLLGRATEIRSQDRAKPDLPSLMSASRLLVDASDRVLAVWDGLPARGFGGTADVVSYARWRRKPLQIIWPDGAVRAGATSVAGSGERQR
ncbi:hypothetical protein ThrDRAFT_00607 [Frankia casuarinae]|jgi:hypothetical protein|nr:MULTISPECIES: hypothetical protein [Frankia]ETA03794.1 hypothetical protein CcI6DRAFT_00629 [Frankia sp. CcI6]EYT93855.1 hypothetical protein ThrDRAFT_00607 [Frankia casuarinae]KDA44499.1 hypothetical protein BMG523Draft_00675 [Frankia sp. BMG5.23]KEZ37132.1 hypothetical protein CEDDRAFT_01384 [Frankia sp. CeD]